MNSLFAEFFSPLVTHLHLSDPTIDSFIFYFPTDFITKIPKFEELLSEDIVHLIEQLLSGSKVSITEDQADKMLIISNLLENEVRNTIFSINFYYHIIFSHFFQIRISLQF